MNVSLYQAAAAMDSSMLWQEAVAENMAETDRPGYKKYQVSFSSIMAGKMREEMDKRPTTPSTAGFQQGLAQAAPTPTEGASQSSFHLPQSTVTTDFTQGGLKPTGIKTDVAITGPGFLRVEDENGNEFFTRDGQLRMNESGNLVTKENYSLVGIPQLDPVMRDKLFINKDGGVSQGGEILGQLEIVEFIDPSKIQRVTGSYFRSDDLQNIKAPPAAGEISTTQVEQGFLEQSNGTSLTEMTSLIRAMRHFEANHKVINVQDDRLNRTIRGLTATH